MEFFFYFHFFTESVCFFYRHYAKLKIYENSNNELLSVLQKIKSEASTVMEIIFSADVVVEGSGRLSVGLNENCILTYTSEDFEETLTSLGNEDAQGDTEYYFGDYTLMSNKYIIPFDDAVKVLEVWINSGKLSNSIKWTDKLY